MKKVYLVGAGPGDPGLLTLKGREALSIADVVLYDNLANPELLRFAPPGAEGAWVPFRVTWGELHGADTRRLLAMMCRRGQVDGADVASDVRISFDRAILGTVATVATIDGKAEVKIPPGTSSGKRLRLRGKGISDHAGGNGDHYVTIHIDVPGDLDDDAKKALVQLASRLRKRGHND